MLAVNLTYCCLPVCLSSGLIFLTFQLSDCYQSWPEYLFSRASLYNIVSRSTLLTLLLDNHISSFVLFFEWTLYLSNTEVYCASLLHPMHCDTNVLPPQRPLQRITWSGVKQRSTKDCQLYWWLHTSYSFRHHISSVMGWSACRCGTRNSRCNSL